MQYNNSDYKLYSKSHEADQNRFFLKTLLWCMLAAPLIIVAGFLKLIPSYGFVYILYMVIILGCSIAFSFFIIKYDPFTPVIKYLLVLTVEALLFILTINQRTEIFLAYALVPLISCLYLDKHFTYNISFLCYITMILSLAVRAAIKENFIETTYTRIQGFARYSIGMTIEYFINFIAVHFISINNHKLIKTDYDTTMKHFNNQMTIIAIFMEIMNKSANLNPYHPRRCSQYASSICHLLRKKKNFSDEIKEEDIPYFSMAVLVHDIGLLILPAEIVTKTTPLNELEIQEIQLHTIQGEELFRQNMEKLDKKFFDMCCSIILNHHEQWNGLGYPNHLSENTIPLYARIVFAADRLEEMTNPSSANETKLSFDDAIEEIRKMGGKEIDPSIAQVIYDSKEDLRVVYEKLNQFMI